jgi:hypothetical protein
MALALLTTVARHERRIRFVFDGALAPAAFTSLAPYSVSGDDGSTVAVAGAIGLLGMPNQLDLALGADLEAGVVYTVGASGVPAADGSATPVGTSAAVRLAAPPPAPVDAEVSPDDIEAALYGIDLVWDGQDYAETAAGDLATVGGSDNVEAALTRRFASDGLPWDDTYGAKPRRYIDGDSGAIAPLRGTLVRQARLDDRVKSARAALSPECDEFDVSVQLIGDDHPLNVPAPKA